MRLAYLTIDDGPSGDFEHKVAFLRARDVPAVFFCVGAQLEERSAAVVQAIRSGFLIANHSYSHPYFSRLSLEEATREITATDAIIEQLYRSAGRDRPMKLFRFPYGDKGKRTRSLKRCLTAMGYSGLRIPKPRLPFPYARWLRLQDADSWWTFDVRDWCLAHRDHAYPIRSRNDVIDRLDHELTRARWRIGSNHVLLLHDHAETAPLFQDLIDHLLTYDIAFTLPQ
ncbi:MAG TPA: polysaccharide deacetylase family protein [Vicinamibacterales bacterium]|nr:polysaccharide deacetylase family protein [Vicinamibacterales bacterium]